MFRPEDADKLQPKHGEKTGSNTGGGGGIVGALKGALGMGSEDRKDDGELTCPEVAETKKQPELHQEHREVKTAAQVWSIYA
jgi:hypothetical protein